MACTNKSNQQLLREQLISDDLGTPGAGLSGPDQLRSWLRLARKTSKFFDRLRRAKAIHVARAKSGRINRLTFGTGIIRKATEGADPTNTVKPTHSGVPFSLVEHRVDAEVSDETTEWAAESQDGGEDYEDAMIMDLNEAWIYDVLNLAVNGDTTSADPALSIDDGWIKAITASGVVVNGASTNSGNFHWKHLAACRKAVPENYKNRMAKYEWLMSFAKQEELLESIADRATGAGDDILVGKGPTSTVAEAQDGRLTIYNRPVNLFDGMGDNVLFADPETLIVAVGKDDFSLKGERGGQYAVRGVTHLYGKLWQDQIVAEVEGAVLLNGLN